MHRTVDNRYLTMGLSWAGPHRNSHSTLEQLEQSYGMSFVSIGTVFKKKKIEKKKRKKEPEDFKH